MNRELLQAVKAVVLFLLVPGALTISLPRAACASGGAGSSGSFWIPYFDDAIMGTAGGKNGLFLIASDEITSSPAPKWIVTKPVTILGMAYVYGSNVSDFKPDLLMYASAGSNGETHIYGLNLSDTASVPTPVQISSFSLTSATGQICGWSAAQTSRKNPTSLFVVLGVGTPSAQGCLSTVQKVVRFVDSPSTAPEVTSLPSYQFTPLYDDGVFVGAIAYRSGLLTGEAYLYSTQLKSEPLAFGDGAPVPVADATLNDGTKFGQNVIYFEMVGRRLPSILYRIDSKSRTLSILDYITSPLPLVGSGIADNTNFYFFISSDASCNFYQVPLAGGAPKLLYTGPMGADSSYSWIGATGSTLIFQSTTVPLVNGIVDDVKATASLYAIPAAKHSSSATKIGGPYDGLVTGFWEKASPTAKPDVYINISHPLSTLSKAAYKFSSVKIPLDGPYSQSPVDNSAYGGSLVINSVPAVWQVTGITDKRGWGGGTVDLIDLATGTGTELTTTKGKSFIVPDGHLGVLVDVTSANVAIGDFHPIASVPPQIGAAVDLTHHFIYTVSVPNTNVSVY